MVLIDPKAQAMTPEHFLELIGWYDAGNANPTHDPIPNNADDQQPSAEDIAKCLCMVCEEPLAGSVESHSIRMEKDFRRSYFYRIPKACKLPNNDDSQKAWCAIERYGMESPVVA